MTQLFPTEAKEEQEKQNFSGEVQQSFDDLTALYTAKPHYQAGALYPAVSLGKILPKPLHN